MASLPTISKSISNADGSSTIPRARASFSHSEAFSHRDGLSWGMTAYFLIAEMAGAGFLSLPNALNNTGWLGAVMMVIFCVAVGYAGIRLGDCWVMLEERWPEHYRQPVRQPYMEIAFRAMGTPGRHVAMATVLFNLLGSTTVFIILMAQLTQALIPALSVCEWVLVYCAIITPVTWFGTPKDFWQASVMAVVSTALCCAVVFVELFVDLIDDAYVQFPNPTVSSFALGFGAILFAFGGATTFPTIQNDMKDRTHFSKSVAVAFMGTLALYLPVAAAGYALLGSSVSSNIILSVEFNIVVKCAVVLEILNLLGTYVISFNPVGQGFEEMFNIPEMFGWKRIVLRSTIVLIETVACLAVPDFALILNLMGGSTATVSCFILPPLMYMKLVDNCDNPKWPKRIIPLWERIFMYEIVIVGIIGGVTSTVSAIIAIVAPDNFEESCFTNFT